MTARQRTRVHLLPQYEPLPVLPRPAEWTERALCAETDPEAFFPGKGEPSAPAKKICAACEVRAECLEDAIQRGERYGVRGGLSERQRRRLRQERGRGKEERASA